MNVDRKNRAFTIATKSHLAGALVWLKSLKDHAPEIDGIIFLADASAGEILDLTAVIANNFPEYALRHSSELQSVESMEIPEDALMRSHYSLLEYCCAIKPHLFLSLAKQNHEAMIHYFDADILVTGDLCQLKEFSENHSFTLLPHINTPTEDSHRLCVLDILRAGLFNFGYLGWNPSIKSGIQLMKWWQKELVNNCRVAFGEGIFTDQSWGALFCCSPDAGIFTSPCTNVAYWNLHERIISKDENGNYLVNGEPLQFFHFSGFSPTKSDVLSIYQDRYILTNFPDLSSLFKEYRNSLMDAGFSYWRESNKTIWLGANSKPSESEIRIQRAEVWAAELEVQAKEAAVLARKLEIQVNKSEEKARSLEIHVQQLGARSRQAEARAGELEVHLQQLELRKQEAEANSNEWHFIAESLQRRLQSIYSSYSWRLTTPFRVAQRLLTGDRTVVREVGDTVKKAIRLILRPVVYLAMRIILKFSNLRSRVESILQEYPNLHQEYLWFAQHYRLVPVESPVTPTEIIQIEEPIQRIEPILPTPSLAAKREESNLTNLSPGAKSIYIHLRAALNQEGMQTGSKPRLAFVSPLPPERTGIADYSSELLPALAEHYDIEIVVAQDRVDDPWAHQNCMVRDIPWLRANATDIDRVLYHIGNSPFHQHMVPLLREVPGIIVLHDFYLGHLVSYLEYFGFTNSGINALYSSHGYNAVRSRYLDSEAAKFEYPANLEILQCAQGVIVHSEYSRELAQLWYGENFSVDWEVIPLLRSPSPPCDKAAARVGLGIDKEDFVVCSFGILSSGKLIPRLLNAWLASALAEEKRCRFVFVGENHLGDSLLETIETRGLSDRIGITGFVSPEVYRQYLMAADMAVQLRCQSRGETSAAVLDCMNYGVPTIVNANGSMAELDRESVWMLPDKFDDAELIDALESLWRAPERRRAMGERASEIILHRHAPPECARRYAEAIERFQRRHESEISSLVGTIAQRRESVPHDAKILDLARNIADLLPSPRPVKRLFIDVSITCRDDYKTGIQRVVRAILLALLAEPPAGYRIEPVYLSNEGGKWHYRYARRYTLGLMNCLPDLLNDEIAEPERGDVLLGLDLSLWMLIEAERSGLYADYRARGVTAYSVIYDLLPVQMPEVFPLGADLTHGQWLQAVLNLDGAIGISKAVADDFAAWQKKELEELSGQKKRQPFHLGWFHLGADMDASSPSAGLPANASEVLAILADHETFLMVGTVEPRKGYAQTLAAFEKIWIEGGDLILAIVGKQGWMVDELADRMRNHPELGKRLFWLDSISDEYLEKVYAASTCLIVASEGEGFGLPLIEASCHKLPILARDIPVFREVAGDHASYFRGMEAKDLADAIQQWLESLKNGEAPSSEGMPYLTWKESARQLMRTIFVEQK